MAFSDHALHILANDLATFFQVNSQGSNASLVIRLIVLWLITATANKLCFSLAVCLAALANSSWR